MKMTKEYFNKRHEEDAKNIILMDCYCRKAEFYKWVYERTGWEWAKKRNRYYVTEGIKLGVASLARDLVDILWLEKFIKKGE